MTILSLVDIEETLLGLATPAALLTPMPGREFKVQFLNRAAYDMLGPAIDTPVGQTLNELPFRTNVGEVFQSIAEQTLTERETRVVEAPVALPEGGRMYLSTTWVPIFAGDDEDEIAAIVLTVEDISEVVSLRMQRANELSLFASGFVQTCAWCGRIRDEGRWRSAADYVADHDSKPKGIRCPDCQSS